jgi:prepilin-type N-terminal cleavage/methylation domain-containing protein
VRRGGFTLIEVMFATLVLLLSMLSAVSSQLISLGLMRTARENTLATAELTAAMEEITGESFDDVLTKFPDAQPIADYTDRTLLAERIVPSYPAGIGDPLTLVVTLTWTDWAGRPARMSVATMKAR